ncbi:hypothetical protein K7432_009078 [Basidiobolus ranarum]|uniref:Uncharacterized protein n=1 Tax=Basidiobolus ranarum TaxID=34480 RepID=A0ABR2VXL5_9FUNG
MLFFQNMFTGIAMASMVAPAFAAPRDRNQPELTAAPEYVELYRNVQACSQEFPATLTFIPDSEKARFKDCVKMIQKFTVSLGQPYIKAAKRDLDATIGVDVFFDALDRFSRVKKSWEKSPLICGVTKQKNGNDICGCHGGYCWRRCHGGIGAISFGIGYTAPPQSAPEWCYINNVKSGTNHQTCSKDQDCGFESTSCAKNYCALF